MGKKTVSALVLTLLLIVIVTLAFDIPPVKSEPTTWTVDDDGPADFQTIREAINAASDGDTIFVCNGTYYENVVVNKTVSLIGDDGLTTVIDGNQTGTCVTIEADNVTISDLKIQHPTPSQGYYVIAMSNCSGIQVVKNYLFDARYKILINNCSNCLVENNIVSGGWKAITLDSSNTNKITKNMIFGCTPYTLPIGPFFGIYLHKSNMNCIEHNTIADCDIGIGLSKSKNNTIRNNIFYDWDILEYHPFTGIRLTSDSSENTIVDNLFQDLQLALTIDQCHNCTIYHNNFLTSQCLVDACTNFWDNGYPSGGNFWSDYNGTDLHSGPYQNETGSDGIGDSPYIIDEDHQDNYPFMKPSLICDLNNDGYVGIQDIILAAEAFGSNPLHDRWHPDADVNRDFYIGIDDIVQVAGDFGKSWK